MQKTDFSKLYELDYNLSNLFAVRQFWKENENFKMNKPRKTSCFLYLCGCSVGYKFENEELHAERGSVIYIPQGAIYETNFFDCDKNLPSTILIEFSLYLPEGEYFKTSNKPCVLKRKHNAVIADLFNEAADVYSSAVISVAKIK